MKLGTPALKTVASIRNVTTLLEVVPNANSATAAYGNLKQKGNVSFILFCMID